MSTITNDEELFRYATRARGRVVLITGGAAGPARSAALAFAKNGANVVIGDILERSAQSIVNAIAKLSSGSGQACWKKCDVTNWQDQVALFKLAVKKFGGVDIVIVGARIGETQKFGTPQISDGKLVKPQLKTLDVNLIGAIYTTQLALHYLPKTRNPAEPLKYVVLLGFSTPTQKNVHFGHEIFDTSQRGLLGFAKSAQLALAVHAIRIATVQTTSLPGNGNIDGTFARTGNAMFFCATNPDPGANGSVWALLQNGTLQKVEEAQEIASPGRPPEYTEL